MRFTVITGIHNGNLCHLRQAVDSVLSQSLGDFRWILCDDGSHPPVREFLEEAARLDSRIFLLHNLRNRGLAYSLNRCIQYAQTSILVRQDGDDLSCPGRFARLVPFMEQHPEYALVSSNISLFDESGVWGKMRYPEKPQRANFLFTIPFMHGAVGLRREALLSHGGYRVSRRTRRCEDLELFMRLYAKGEMGYTIQEELYAYREDLAAQQRRRYRYRIEEAAVRLEGFARLGLLPKGLLYAAKPLAVGLIPQKLLQRMKDQYYGRRE